MPALYLVEQNTKIRIRNRRLQVERDLSPDANPQPQNSTAQPEVLLSVPLGQVGQVILFGNIGLTTPAIEALLGQQSEVVFLTLRGEYRGRLVGQMTPHVPLRRAQYAALNDPHLCLGLAKAFVKAKLEHQRALLLRNSREERHPNVESSAHSLNQSLTQTPHKTSLHSLRGLEGASTAAYFSGLRTFFGPQWRFDNRNRRPPADPVNVLLSLGYTLLAQSASAAVETVGLDPYAGFLHDYVYNRPALALDIMEEFRPVVDGLAMWACRSGQITPDDFTPGPPERPVVFGDEGKRRFIRAYETRLDQPHTHPLRGVKFPLRQCIIEQARQLAECLTRQSADYRGMGFR